MADDAEQKLTKLECLEILERFRGWNHGQNSFELAFRGERTAEDAIYDARRALILKATKRLEELA